jgi:hypothetical protein
MLNLQRELEKLLEKYPDPRKGVLGQIEFNEKQVRWFFNIKQDFCFNLNLINVLEPREV